MKTYHYNVKTNEASECHARKQQCPINSEHFTTIDEAQQYGEKINSHQTFPKLNKKSRNNDSTNRAMDAWNDVSETKNFMDHSQILDIGLESIPQNVDPELINSGYFDSHKNVGKLDKSKLTDESYKHFGFKGEGALFDYPSKDFLDQIETESEKELASLSHEEKFALSLYSSQEFKNINPVLNGQKSIHELDVDVDTFIQRVGTIDRAVAKGPGHQRKVYRGDSHLSQRDQSVEHIHGWVDENRALGSEVSFSSFVSTTPNVEAAKTYLGTQKSGVIYEIQTSKGVNLSSISGYGDEHEVLLPRESTFVVVGVQKPRDDIAIVQIMEETPPNRIGKGKLDDKILS